MICIDAEMEHIASVTMTNQPHIAKAADADEVHISCSGSQASENQN
jgi:hypothetical protein